MSYKKKGEKEERGKTYYPSFLEVSPVSVRTYAAPPLTPLGPVAERMAWVPPPPKLAKLSLSLQNFAIFWRARARLHQDESLPENMRLTAFFKIHKTCILLHRCNLKIFAKNRFEKSAIFVKNQQHFAKVTKLLMKICKMLPKFNFKNFSLRIW